MQFANNHSFVYQNLLWLVSSVYILFFIGTDAACLPAGRFANNHSFVYQNLLWLGSFSLPEF
ncbi:MAG: hypothetical protein APF83_14220 [Lutibacter sp. BRH_c52]|nr:MAG: hypothetical protein APF83_14220 [Lutibacter sp. BRH_c52]